MLFQSVRQYPRYKWKNAMNIRYSPTHERRKQGRRVAEEGFGMTAL